METVRTNKNKGGRPPKTIKKEIRITVRFSEQEHATLREKSAKAGGTVSDYIRKVVTNTPVNPRLTDEERHFVRQLVGIANNINQMAKRAHQEGLLRAMHHFEGHRRQVDHLLKKLEDGE